MRGASLDTARAGLTKHIADADGVDYDRWIHAADEADLSRLIDEPFDSH